MCTARSRVDADVSGRAKPCSSHENTLLSTACLMTDAYDVVFDDHAAADAAASDGTTPVAAISAALTESAESLWLLPPIGRVLPFGEWGLHPNRDSQLLLASLSLLYYPFPQPRVY